MDIQTKRKYSLANIICITDLARIVNRNQVGIFSNYLRKGKLTEAPINGGKKTTRYIIADDKLRNYIKKIEAIDTEENGAVAEYFLSVSQIVDFI